MRQNWRQFTLLVVINAFVGGMVGLERSYYRRSLILKFGIAATTAILSFIVVLVYEGYTNITPELVKQSIP